MMSCVAVMGLPSEVVVSADATWRRGAGAQTLRGLCPGPCGFHGVTNLDYGDLPLRHDRMSMIFADEQP